MGFVWNVGRGTHNEHVVAVLNVEQVHVQKEKLHELLIK